MLSGDVNDQGTISFLIQRNRDAQDLRQAPVFWDVRAHPFLPWGSLLIKIR
jgi:hypothetical protein